MKKKVKKTNSGEAALESQLKDLQEALAQSQQQFQNLVKNIPGIVYLCYYDEPWTMHYIVKDIERVSGYPASDFINNNVRSYASIIHPDDVEEVRQAVKKGVDQDKPFETEYRIIRKDGEIAWLYGRGQKVHSQGDKIWLNGIIFDITQIKQTAIALDIATEEWQVTFDAIPSAVFLLNREFQIMKCNRSAETLLGKNKDELIGRRYCKVIDGQDIPSEDSPYMRMIKSRHKASIIRSIGNKEVEFTVVPIISPKGEIYGSVLLIVDVSKLKRTEMKLRNQKKELKSIFHTAPIGIGVVSGRKLVQVNEQFCNLSGYSEKELIGQNTRMLYINDEEYERVGRGYQKLKGSEIVTLQTYLKCRDGKEIKVSLNVSALNIDINGFTFTLMPIE